MTTPADTAHASVDGSRVAHHEWRAVTVDGAARPVPAGQAFSLLLGPDGLVSGQADCNRYFGAYTLDEAAGTLRLRDLGSTLAYCGDASLDRAFLAVLQNARTFTVDGTALTLRAENGATVTFKR